VVPPQPAIEWTTDPRGPPDDRYWPRQAGAALAATAGCLGSTDSDDEQPSAYTTPAAAEFDGVVDSQWLESNLDDVHLLDARDEEAFSEGRIPGAYHFPDSEMLDSYAEETSDGFEVSPRRSRGRSRKRGSSPTTTWWCTARSRTSGTYAIYTLNALGHEGQVSLLDGGFTVWDAAGGETVSEAPEAQEATYEPELDTGVVATREFVADNVDEDGAAIPILDMRSPEEYWGVDERGDQPVRFGHVTGATNLNFVQSIDDEAGRAPLSRGVGDAVDRRRRYLARRDGGRLPSDRDPGVGRLVRPRSARLGGRAQLRGGAGPTGERSRRITATTTPAARTPGQSSTRSRKWSSSALLESHPSGILWNETG